MKCSSPSRIDRVTHDNFVSSLRTWCNTDEDVHQTCTDRTLSWINQISERLLVGSKVDLMKITTLDRLSKVEIDFLRLSVPNLSYFAKTRGFSGSNEASLQILKSWTGVPVSQTETSKPFNSVLINKLKFKNILMKLLTNPSGDKRIRRMQAFILNPTEMELVSSSSPDTTPTQKTQAATSPHFNNHSECDNSSEFKECDCFNWSNHCTHCKKCKLTHDFNPGVHCNKCHGSGHSSPTVALEKSHLKNPSTHDQTQKDCTLTPTTGELLSLCKRRIVPKLHIEYVEPTPGLLSSTYNKFFSKSSQTYHHHNCFTDANNGNKWVETLRGGYIPSHIHFSP